MNDDATSLSAVWMSDQPVSKERVASTVEAVLDEDRAARTRERGIRGGCLLALALLLPVLLWCAAHGVTPLVRGAYALMAVGSAMLVAVEWIYLDWSRQALPGPADARSQLQRTAFMLRRQAMLMQTAPLWAAPVFIGTAMIGLWLYWERTHAAGFAMWTITAAAAWLALVLGPATARARLSDRLRQMERLLGDLQ